VLCSSGIEPIENEDESTEKNRKFAENKGRRITIERCRGVEPDIRGK
jgi:hypothetical protein